MVLPRANPFFLFILFHSFYTLLHFSILTVCSLFLNSDFLITVSLGTHAMVRLKRWQRILTPENERPLAMFQSQALTNLASKFDYNITRDRCTTGLKLR